MQKTYKIICTAIFITISSPSFPETTKPILPTKEVSTIQVLFDVKRVVYPNLITNTTNPVSSRAFLPKCPPGSTYVSGVNPNLIELDQAPLYSYCNCMCKGNCNNLPGVTSTGGRQPIYTATVTCATKVQGWFDPTLLAQTNIPHKYYYCQAGNCVTNPLPAALGYSVPVGGYTNTTKIDFQACGQLKNNLCSLPDLTSPGRSAGNIPG